MQNSQEPGQWGKWLNVDLGLEMSNELVPSSATLSSKLSDLNDLNAWMSVSFPLICWKS